MSYLLYCVNLFTEKNIKNLELLQVSAEGHPVTSGCTRPSSLLVPTPMPTDGVPYIVGSQKSLPPRLKRSLSGSAILRSQT